MIDLRQNDVKEKRLRAENGCFGEGEERSTERRYGRSDHRNELAERRQHRKDRRIRQILHRKVREDKDAREQADGQLAAQISAQRADDIIEQHQNTGLVLGGKEIRQVLLDLFAVFE